MHYSAMDIWISIWRGGASTLFRWNHSSQSLHWFKRVLTFSPEFNAESIRSFLTCSLCLLMMGSECVWALGEDSNFELVRGPWNWILRHFQAEGACSLTQTFAESCVDLEAAHLSVLMVWRLPHVAWDSYLNSCIQITVLMDPLPARHAIAQGCCCVS